MQEANMPRTTLMCSAAAMLMLSIPATAQVQGSEAQTSQLGQIEDQGTQSFDAKDELSSSERREFEAYEADELASLHDEDQVTQSFDAKDELATSEIPGPLDAHE